MKTVFSYIQVLLAASFGIFLFYSCANQIAPPGGEVDKIPPEIVEVYPEDGTTNFHDDYIEVTFSEYVQKSSVQSAIFISPEIEGEIEYDWSGKSLSIEFADSLKSNTTYLVSFGTGISDLNNGNKMTRAFNLTFSTGNKIDNGVVEGRVFTDEEPSKVNIYAYRLDTLNVNPMKTKPDYISQVNLDGEYKLLALPRTAFRVFAVRDEFKDRLYNVGEDEYGAPFTDIVLSETDSVFRGLNFLLTKEDTIVPGITNLVMTDMNHIMLEFSEEIDLKKLNPENFVIVDSSSKAEKKIDYAYVGSGNEKKIFLAFADSLSEESENYLLSRGIFDKYGNESKPDTSFISVNTKADTVNAKLIKTTANYGTDKLDFIDGFIELTFDDGFDVLAAANKFQFADSKKRRKRFTVKKIDDSKLRIDIDGKLRPNSDYVLSLDLNLISDAAGNKLDSIQTIKFKTVNDLFFSGLSGKIKDSSDTGNVVLGIFNASDKKTTYSINIGGKKKFDFKRVIPGKYLLWGFFDSDSNGKYTFGKIYPYEPSEKFSYYPDTLNLRARWPVGDIILNFN